MRFLEQKDNGNFSLTEDIIVDIPSYAILSHTWGLDTEEVTFKDLMDNIGRSKAGYDKIKFCGEQAKHDGLQYFWVDTCCIDKSNNAELSESIISMFRWYRNAARCYVYLADVSTSCQNPAEDPFQEWEVAFRQSRWFSRGWTLQELIAPPFVEFFSLEGKLLGSKKSLLQQINEITGIAVDALQGNSLSRFSVDERLSWAKYRKTKRDEDRAYSLLGIFNVYMPPLYGEGFESAFRRLREEIAKHSSSAQDVGQSSDHSDVKANLSLCRPKSSPHFTGRQEIIDELARYFYPRQPGTSPRREAEIIGMSGTGRTQTALKFSEIHQDRFDYIFWVDGSSPGTLEQSLSAITKSYPTSSANEFKALANTNWLESTKAEWLILISNAEGSWPDHEIALPKVDRGNIIYMTRWTPKPRYCLQLPLDVLSQTEAIELLLKTAGITEVSKHLHDRAVEIVKELECLPMAVAQAGSYIATGICYLEDYLQIFRNHRKELLDNDPNAFLQWGQMVYAVWDITRAELERQESTRPRTVQSNAAETAILLLQTFAYFHNSDIPEEIFNLAAHFPWNKQSEVDDITGRERQEWMKHLPVQVLQLDTTQQWDPFLYRQGINKLGVFSLITRQSDKKACSMHKLVQFWVYDRMSILEKEKYLYVASSLLYAAWRV